MCNDENWEMSVKKHTWSKGSLILFLESQGQPIWRFYPLQATMQIYQKMQASR